jgi:hypothetical protein
VRLVGYLKRNLLSVTYLKQIVLYVQRTQRKILHGFAATASMSRRVSRHNARVLGLWNLSITQNSQKWKRVCLRPQAVYPFESGRMAALCHWKN